MRILPLASLLGAVLSLAGCSSAPAAVDSEATAAPEAAPHAVRKRRRSIASIGAVYRTGRACNGAPGAPGGRGTINPVPVLARMHPALKSR